MTYSPAINLVPLPLHFRNLRELMTQGDWKKVRSDLIAERGVVCEICGKVETAPPRIYAHEDWEYDVSTDPAVARLNGFQLVCWHCHACEHFEHTKILGKTLLRAVPDTIAHFCRLNEVDETAFLEHEREAQEIYHARNKLRWTIDWGPYSEWIAERWDGNPFKCQFTLQERLTGVQDLNAVWPEQMPMNSVSSSADRSAL